eukprot:TRINITY_DN29052_c0_g3_i1.p1 TRINITY_DN29052_c0_g3~~TRINITY_DN29052_c0_g3_i1.p1  ORF type:complete len:349 (-),score=46.69 TRINITY_DN29052_c0_g3_i1:64-1068(-)
MSASAPSDFKEVCCPLLGIDNGQKVYIIGKPGASTLVLCQAGYPDKHDAFLPLARELAKEDCLVGVTCMPEFDTDGKGPLRKPEGYDFNECALCFGQAAEALQKEAAAGSTAPLVLVLHDWGVAPGTIYANRCLAEAKSRPSIIGIVYFDVLPSAKGAAVVPDSMYELLVHVIYRGHFAWSFLLSRISGLLGTVNYAFGSAFIFGILGRWLNPVGRLDAIKGQGPSISSFAVLPRISYPYYHLFREMLGKKGALLNEFHLPPLEKAPALYIYGKNKNTMFHAKTTLDVLDATDNCEQVGISNAGHWVYRQQSDECFRRVKSFIRNLPRVAKSAL